MRTTAGRAISVANDVLPKHSLRMGCDRQPLAVRTPDVHEAVRALVLDRPQHRVLSPRL
jgi:hypothetical protein